MSNCSGWYDDNAGGNCAPCSPVAGCGNLNCPSGRDRSMRSNLKPSRCPRPSISELQRHNLETTSQINPYTSFEVREAAPVLLEIAAAAMQWRLAQQGDTYKVQDMANQRLYDVLAKVRP